MSSGLRPIRLAAQKAEDHVGAIAKQEEETRNELYGIAQYEERSAHITRVPNKFVSWKLNSEEGIKLLRGIAQEDPSRARPVAPFTILKFTNDGAKQKFQEFFSKPIVIDSDEEQDRGDSHEDIPSSDPVRCCLTENDLLNESDIIATQQSCSRASQLTWTIPKPRKRRRRRSSPVPESNLLAQCRIGRHVPPGGLVKHHPPTEQIIRISAPVSHCNLTPPENASSDQGSDHASPTSTLQAEDLLTPPQEEDEQEAQDTAVSDGVMTVAENSPSVEQISLPDPAPAASETPRVTINDCGMVSNFSNFLSLPARNLPEHVSYRVGKHGDERLMKYQQPPNGWEGCIKSPYNTDFSDPRYWSAHSWEDQDEVWNALSPTIREYLEITQEEYMREHITCLPFGYDASHTEIQHRFSQWCFTSKGAQRTWIVGGKVNYRLFKLERWYGLLADYVFAPNWPHRLRDFSGKIIQNPDCFACDECIQSNVFCYGHREDYKARCRPCIVNGRQCSKLLI